MVATPSGPVPIENLLVGDQVIGFENDRPMITEVSATWENGIQEVFPFGSFNKTILAGTANHQLWASTERERRNYRRVPLSKISRWYYIRRQFTRLITGGSVHVPTAYYLAAFLGNGCCSIGKITSGTHQKFLYISSPDDQLPNKISNFFGCEVKKLHKDNFTYRLTLSLDDIDYYRQWASMRKAHQKIADWGVIDTWDRESCFAFLAGILDTDGSIRFKTQNQHDIIISVFMQAKTVVESCIKIIFKYFQVDLSLLEEKSHDYVNGSCYGFVIGSNILSLRVLDALKPYLIKTINTETVNLRNLLPNRIGLVPQGDPYMAHTFDITVDNETNLYCLHNQGIVTSNSGKTEIAKRRMIRKAVERCIRPDSRFHNARYFAGAPTRDQAKRIYWDDLKMLIPKQFVDGRIRESELIIPLRNNVEIHVLGLDKPERVEGSPWDGCILDEFGNMKEVVWTHHVRPSLSDRTGWCDMIGVPEGRNHYYQRYKQALACSNGEWAAFHWLSSEILPPEEIASAKDALDELSFRQEYEADFVNFSGMAYYSFSPDVHAINALSYDHTRPLILAFDFNVDPGVCAIGQEQALPGLFDNHGPAYGTGWIGEVYIPQNSNTQAVCRRIIKDWGKHQGPIYCYGDATGGARKTSQTEGSDWDIIERILYDHYGSDRVHFMYSKANPSERARINAVNSRLRSMNGQVRMMVDPEAAPHIVIDLEGTRLLEGGSGEIDKKRDKTLSHISDALGYYVFSEYPIIENAAGLLEVGGLY